MFARRFTRRFAHPLHSLLDLGEYDRAAHILSTDSAPKELLGGLGLFVRAYSLFLAGEKKKEEEMVELAEPLERSKGEKISTKNIYIVSTMPKKIISTLTIISYSQFSTLTLRNSVQS